MNKWVLGLATVIHLLPHPFGVSSIGATALYAGAFGDKRTSWLVPMVPLTLGLTVTGLYEPVVMLFVFAGFSLSTLAGRWFLSSRRNLTRFAGAVAGGATLFFVVSNLSMWLVGYYPPTLAGLIECYVAGLPFYGLSMLADAAYCFALFGVHRALAGYRQRLAAT
ncbi:MAG: hypothetical protein MJA32_04320 [Proteobacteria bacterium]|nr:hypothetical protein [Pseudomonadota bacterium]